MSRLRRALTHDVVRAGVQSYAFSTLTLAANLVAGVVTARALGPEGRGEAVAIAMLAVNLGLIFAFGCAHAASYRYARDASSGGRLLTAWAALLLGLGALAIATGQLAIPVLFDAQSEEAVTLGRLYLATILLVLANELTRGLLLGAGEYLFVSAARFAQPALVAVTQLVLWALDAMSVESVLITAAASTLLVQVVAFARVRHVTGGFGPFDRALARETYAYGFRGQGIVLGGTLNQRLDLLILPAFVVAADIGLYSIAANVSLIVYAVANSFSSLLLPAAVRSGERGPATVVRSLHAVGAIALGAALVLFVLARPALEVVYGDAFGDAASTLRLLLPGAVLLAAASILNAGLYAAGRPGAATSTQVTGLLVTVVGLLVFVPDGGITAAALVSSVAYATVFTVALVRYRRALGAPWSAFLHPSRL
ncbi:MAG: lipopolysaccharide biosynthesis protein [Actinomycetota bacterium]|nr:lipopolysaccharide biosynthesis protein [Actinomycetota bacterium]MDQ5807702.1 lipopolysaccharide biosynthesis protein [Actinomycetota bacterium]